MRAAAIDAESAKEHARRLYELGARMGEDYCTKYMIPIVGQMTVVAVYGNPQEVLRKGIEEEGLGASEAWVEVFSRLGLHGGTKHVLVELFADEYDKHSIGECFHAMAKYTEGHPGIYHAYLLLLDDKFSVVCIEADGQKFYHLDSHVRSQTGINRWASLLVGGRLYGKREDWFLLLGETDGGTKTVRGVASRGGQRRASEVPERREGRGLRAHIGILMFTACLGERICLYALVGASEDGDQ